jgi:hypothetical protein
MKLIACGYDFGDLKLTETKRLNDDMSQQVFSWIGFCQEHITDEKLAAWFKKDKVTSNLAPTVARAKKLNGTELVTFVKHTIPQDSLQRIVEGYDIKEKTGIGFVIIMECFYKPQKTASAYFTFFDIATKKILLADHFSGKEADGYGLTNYWGVSIIGITKNYSTLFKDKVKAFKTGKSKS